MKFAFEKLLTPSLVKQRASVGAFRVSADCFVSISETPDGEYPWETAVFRKGELSHNEVEPHQTKAEVQAYLDNFRE